MIMQWSMEIEMVKKVSGNFYFTVSDYDDRMYFIRNIE